MYVSLYHFAEIDRILQVKYNKKIKKKKKISGSDWLGYLTPTPLLVFSASPSLLLYYLTRNLMNLNCQPLRARNLNATYLDIGSQFLGACRLVALSPYYSNTVKFRAAISSTPIREKKKS